jgi:putative ABC transport system permease protein
MSLVFAEAGILGLLGAVLGLTALFPVSSFLSSFYQLALSQLYAASTVTSPIGFDLAGLALTLGAAIAMAVCGALFPALRILGIRGGLAQFHLSPIRISFGHSGLLALASFGGYLIFFYAALGSGNIMFAYLAAVCLVPLALSISSFLLSALAPLHHAIARISGSAAPLISFAWIRASGAEAGRAVGSVALAFGLILGMSIMIVHFGATVHGWANATLKADLYIRPKFSSLDSAIPDHILEFLAARSQLLFPTRFALLDDPGSVIGIDMSDSEQVAFYTFIDGAYPQSGTEVLISEATARKKQLKVEDSINIGGTDFLVAGIIQDFSSEHTLVYMDRVPFTALFGSRPIAAVSLILADSVSADALLEEMQHKGYSKDLEIFSNAGIREQVETIFASTFTITSLLRVVLLLVASLGLATLLLQSLILRLPELRTLIALGASKSQLRWSMLMESLSVSGYACISGSVIGILLGKLLTDLVTPLAFGWRIATEVVIVQEFIFPCVAVVIAGFVSGILPLRKLDKVLYGN